MGSNELGYSDGIGVDWIRGKDQGVALWWNGME